jgi:hypothetical protein
MKISHCQLPVVLFAVLLLLASCSFNHAFFKPGHPFNPLPEVDSVEYWTVRNEKGKLLSAALFSSGSSTRGSVFMLKGNTGNITDWIDVINKINAHGYRVFVFDYEGYGESQGKATHKNILEDSQFLLDSLKKRSEIKNLPLLLWGFSFGGNPAVKLAADNPGDFDLLILEGCFTSPRAIALDRVPWYFKPFAWPVLRSPYSAKKIIGNLRNLPVLVVHSVEDKEIPYRMGEELFNKANEPKIFFEVLGKHCQALLYYDDDYFMKIDALLN